jgi:hypothetical protein
MGDKNQWNYYVLQNFYIIARDGDNVNTNRNAQKCKLLFAFYVIMHTRVKLKEDSHKDYPFLFGVIPGQPWTLAYCEAISGVCVGMPCHSTETYEL